MDKLQRGPYLNMASCSAANKGNLDETRFDIDSEFICVCTDTRSPKFDNDCSYQLAYIGTIFKIYYV